MAPTPDNPDPNGTAFSDELRKLGRIDGKNIHIEYRYIGSDTGRVPQMVDELVQLKLDVIATPYSAAIRAAKAATKTIPIVIATTEDPVASGYVESLARPGGNITGVTRLTRGLAAKRLELLKEAVPTMSRVGVLHARWTDVSSFHRPGDEWDDAAQKLKIQLISLSVELKKLNFEGAIRSALDNHVNGLVVRRNPIFLRHSKQLFELVSKARLPTVCEGAEEAAAGGLLSYASSDADQFRRAAHFVDRILKGAKPADLPVEQPTTFEFVVNMKTAKALGITIPQTIMIRADRVIQ